MIGERSRKVAVALAAVLITPACGKKEGAGGANEPSASQGPVAGKGKLGADVKRMLGAVPDDVDVVAWVDAPAPVWNLLLDPGLLPMKPKIKEKLDEDLHEFIEGRVGLDVSGVKGAVLFGRAKADDTWAVLVPGVKGKLKEDKLVLDDAKKVVAQVHDGVLGIGSEEALQGAFKRLGGKEGKLAGWLEKQQKGALLAAAVRVKAFEPPPDFAVDRASAGLGAGGFRVIATGEEDKLEHLRDRIGELKKQALSSLEAERKAMTAEGQPVVAGAGSIIQEHMMRAGLDQLDPEVKDGHLSVSFKLDLGDPAFMVAGAGVLAAIAIPAFMKYIKKSKAAEARMMILKLDQGARRALADNGQLPPSAGPTPPLGTCCRQGGKCAPDASLWATEPWTSLRFSVDDPHYYSYEFSNSGSDYTVSAYGDLDCDGVYSTFRRTGSSIGIYRENELE